jgi:hypothetical protein
LPLVESVVEGLRDVAAGEVSLAFLDDEAVEFSGDGKAAGAPDECSAGGWRGGLAGLLFDVLDALYVKQDRDGDFGGGFPGKWGQCANLDRIHLCPILAACHGACASNFPAPFTT